MSDIESGLHSISEKKEPGESLKSMDYDFNCKSNDDTYRKYMSELIEAIGNCQNISIAEEKKITSFKNKIDEFKKNFSMIIDKFLELDINKKKETNFYKFYNKFIKSKKQDDDEQIKPADKLLKVEALAENEGYPDLFTDPDHITLKAYIKIYVIETNDSEEISSVFRLCSDTKSKRDIFIRDIFNMYKKIITTIEDTIICDKNLSEDKKKLFLDMYNICLHITRYEIAESPMDDDDCKSNDDKYSGHMSQLKEAIGNCPNISNTSELITNIEKEINDFKAKFSVIIDNFLKLNINDEKKNKFYTFDDKFLEFEKQDDYKQMEPAKKLSIVKQFAKEKYPDFNTMRNHKILKESIELYIRKLNINPPILFSVLNSCSNRKWNRFIFNMYQNIISINESIIICDKNLSEDKKKLFTHMYNIYSEIVQYEIAISGSGGKKKTRRKARKLNKKKSIRKKSHKRKRRTRKY